METDTEQTDINVMQDIKLKLADNEKLSRSGTGYLIVNKRSLTILIDWVQLLIRSIQSCNKILRCATDCLADLHQSLVN